MRQVGEIGLDFGCTVEIPEVVNAKHLSDSFHCTWADQRVEYLPRDGADNTHAHDLALEISSRLGVPKAGCDLHCYTDGPEVMTFADLDLFVCLWWRGNV